MPTAIARKDVTCMFNTNRSAVELGYILKQIPGYEFSVDRFDDRLRLQKTVYLLQAFGINRGYEFGWYLRGPYCSLVAMDGFDLRGVYGRIPKGETAFTTRRANVLFDRFCSLVSDKSTAYLEIAVYLHHIKHGGTGGSDDDIRKKVEDKRPEFTAEQVEEAWSDLLREGLI